MNLQVSVGDLLHIIDGHARQVSKAMEHPQTLNTEALKSHVARMYGLVEQLHEVAVENDKRAQAAQNGAGEEAPVN